MANNNVRILSDVSLAGALSFETNHTGFPPNPAPRTLVVKDGVPYLYTELVNGSGYFTWTPIGARQSAHLHTQGVASTEWTVTHNFNSVNYGYFVYDADHNLMLANTQVVDTNTVKVLLSSATTGTAVFFSMESIFTQMVNASDNVKISTISLRDAAGVLTVNNNPVAMAEAVAASFAQVYTKAQSDSFANDAVAVESQARIAADDALTLRLDDLRISTSTLDSLNEVVAAFTNADSDLTQAITNVLGTHTSELAAEIADRVDADSSNLLTAKNYTDAELQQESDARVAGDLTVLAAANLYTDTSIQDLAAGTVAQADKLSTARAINGIAFDGSSDISFTTDQIGEGTYSKYFTDARATTAARNALSVTGAATYDATTGNFNVTGGVTSVVGKTGAVELSKGDVGLGSVDNTADAAKPVSSAQTAAIAASLATALAASTPIAHVGSGGVAHAVATTSVAGFMSGADKLKLDGIAANSNNYTLPLATGSVVGGVRIGSGLVVDSSGIVSAVTYTAGSGIVIAGSAVLVDTTVVARKFAFTVGGSTSVTVNHNLNTFDVQVQIYLASTGESVECDIIRSSANSVMLNFVVVPDTNSVRVIVVG